MGITMKIIQEEKGFTVKDSDGKYKLWWSEEDKVNQKPMFLNSREECLKYCHAAGLYPHKETGVLLSLNA